MNSCISIGLSLGYRLLIVAFCWVEFDTVYNYIGGGVDLFLRTGQQIVTTVVVARESTCLHEKLQCKPLYIDSFAHVVVPVVVIT